MWTSHSGDAYISLTVHYVHKEFKMNHSNLNTCPLPGVYNHTNIAIALQKLADEWLIDFESQVFSFTTDNSFNIVTALKDDLKLHILCDAHTLNLYVEEKD